MANPITTDFNGQEGTLLFWVKTTSSDYLTNTTPADYNLASIVAQYGADTFRLDLFIDDGGESANVNDGLSVLYRKNSVASDRCLITDTDFPSTDWHMVAVTWSLASGKLSYYLDSDAAVTASNGFVTWSTAAPSYFEITLGPNQHVMAHMALWDTPLPASDIVAIYDVGDAADKVTLVPEIGATGSRLIFYNPTADDCYITKLQMRGKRIKRYRPVENEAVDDTSLQKFGRSELMWDMPYEDGVAFGTTWAESLLGSEKNPVSKIGSLAFTANASEAVFKSALALEPGDRISVRETQTGVSKFYYVQGIELELANADTLNVLMYLIEAETANFWQLEVAGFGELDSTSWLAI